MYTWSHTTDWPNQSADDVLPSKLFPKRCNKPHTLRQQFTWWQAIFFGTICARLHPVGRNSNSQSQLNVCNDASWWVRAFLSMNLISIFLCLAISNSILPIASPLHCPQQKADSLKKEAFSTSWTKHFFFKLALLEAGERQLHKRLPPRVLCINM